MPDKTSVGKPAGATTGALDELERRLVLIESARASIKGIATIAVFLLVAMGIIAAWGIQAKQYAVSAFIVASAFVSVGWRVVLERKTRTAHGDEEWMRLVRELKWSALPSGVSWFVASLTIFPTLPPLESIAYLFALSLAFTTAATHMVSTTFTAGYVGLQVAALLVSSGQQVWSALLAMILLAWCSVLWVGIARTTYGRVNTLAAKLARTALARRLWAERARRRMVAAETRAAAAKSRAAESRALFVARVSHELRTPLQTIISGLELLQQRMGSGAVDAKNHALLERLSRSTDQVLTLSHDLADFVRWESGTLPVRLTAVDVPFLIDDIAAGLAERARLRGVRLSVEHHGPPGTSQTDAARLRAIVTNLVTNAIKYAPAGAVRLATERVAQGTVVITVQDNGPGLPDRVLKVLGSPWVRGDNARVQEEGFGLGLSIVMALAQEIGAQVSVSSSAHGTEFRVAVPPESVTVATDQAGAPDV